MKGVDVNIGKEFSRYPAGRTPADGKFNGETFRKKFLLPALSESKPINIILDDAVDFGSSFLEEAFGGLVRCESFTEAQLKSLLNFSAVRHPFVPDEIWLYIREAAESTIH